MIADRIMALLDTMTIASLDSLPPARRQQFAQLCRHWADVAEQRKREPKNGVLFDLRQGQRGD